MYPFSKIQIHRKPIKKKIIDTKEQVEKHRMTRITGRKVNIHR